MMEVINPKDWYYFGRWIECALFSTPWKAYAFTKAAQNLDLTCIGSTITFDGYYWILQRDLDALRASVKDFEDDFCQKLFAECHRAHADLRRVHGLKMYV